MSAEPPPSSNLVRTCGFGRDHRMIELTGLVGRRRDKAFLKEHGMGHMRTAVPRKHWRLPKDGQPYAVDNGKFAVCRKGKTWSEPEFLAALRSIPNRDPTLLFVVVPDIVDGGDESLRLSQEWRARLDVDGFGWMPFALAVQPCMTWTDVLRELDSGRWAYVFVGGDKPYKYETTAAWHALACPRGVKLHVAAIYKRDDQAWARSRFADSIDSTGWARNGRFVQEIIPGRQQQVLGVPG